MDTYLVSEISRFDLNIDKICSTFFYLKKSLISKQQPQLPVLNDRWHQPLAHIFEQRFGGGGSTWILAQLIHTSTTFTNNSGICEFRFRFIMSCISQVDLMLETFFCNIPNKVKFVHPLGCQILLKLPYFEIFLY